jgi:protoheme IX farnesyltransferase
MNLFKHIKTYLELGKWPVTSEVSLTTAAGYILYSGKFSWNMVWPVTGIFLLACGSSAVNQIQEARYDAQMDRTRNRPLPSGRISLLNSWLAALVYTVSGSVIIWFGTNLTALLLGWFSFVWYNLVYTYLKRHTVYAVIPGSLIGSLPPVIGWVSAGGPLTDIHVVIIALFFFIWQIPHFWLLTIKYGADYTRAGLPSLHHSRSIQQILRLIYLWIILTVAITAFLPFTGLIYSTVARLGIWLTAGAIFLTFTLMFINRKEEFEPGYYFLRLNFYMLLAVILIILDRPVILNLPALM